MEADAPVDLVMRDLSRCDIPEDVSPRGTDDSARIGIAASCGGDTIEYRELIGGHVVCPVVAATFQKV